MTLSWGQRVGHLVATWGLIWLAFLSLIVLELVAGRIELNEIASPDHLFIFSHILSPFALLAVAAAFIIRGGPMMRLFRMTLQNERGQPVSRLRSGLRAAVAWSPILIVPTALYGSAFAAVLFGVDDTFVQFFESEAVEVTMALLVLSFLAGVVVTCLRPERGWQDLIAGTRIVRV